MLKNKIKFTNKCLLLALTCATTTPAAAQVTMPNQTYVLPTTATIELHHGTFNSNQLYINGFIQTGQIPIAIPLRPKFNATWNQTYPNIPYDVATNGYDFTTTFIFNQTNLTNTYSLANHQVITDLSDYKDTNAKTYTLPNNKGSFYASVSVDALKVQLDSGQHWNANDNVSLRAYPDSIFKEITVNNGGSFAAKTLYISGAATLNLNTGGKVTVDKLDQHNNFNWNGGTLEILDGIDVRHTGTSDALGDKTISTGRTLSLGGTSTVKYANGLRINGGTLNLNGNLTVSQNGTLNQTSGNITYGPNSITEFSAFGKGYFAGTQTLSQNATLKITQESDVTMTDSLRLSNANVIVDGYKATLTVDSDYDTSDPFIAFSSIGYSSTATFKNTAKGHFHSRALYLGQTANSNSTSKLNIESGAQVTVNALFTAQGSKGTSTINITGANSKLIQRGTTNYSHLYIGTASADSSTFASTATVNLTNGGTLQTSNYSASTRMQIKHNGTLNINGGTLDARNNIDVIGGTINHTAGSFLLANNKRLRFTEEAQANFAGEHHFNNGKILNVRDGSNVTYSGKLIVGQTSTATLNVDGSGSTLNLGNNTIASNSWGNGTGTTNTSFSNNSVTNFNYQLTNIGVTSNSSGTTNFMIQSGATVTTNSLAIGTDRGLNTTLSIDGTNSKLTLKTNSTLTAGGANAGWTNINITNGGQLLTGTGHTTIQQKGILNLASGTLTANSDLNINGPIARLNQTAGTLNLNKNLNVISGTFNQTGGTTNFAPDSTMTFSQNAVGYVKEIKKLNINTGSQIFTQDLQVGTNTDAGEINLNDPGSWLTINGTNGLTIGGGTGSGIGTVNLNGGNARVNSGPTTINQTGTLNITDGYLEVWSDITLNGGTINIDGNGGLNMYNTSINDTTGTSQLDLLNGQLHDAKNINLDLNHQGGLLANQSFNHTLNIDGNYTMSENASLTLSLSSKDQIYGLSITGDATLDGHLELFDAALYTAQFGDQLEIITANTITGQFDSISLDSLSHLLDLELIYESNRVIAEVISKLKGDYDIDGDVDTDDLNYVKANFGSTTNLQDLAAVRNNFGNTLPPATSIPEPSTLLILLVTTLTLSRRSNI